MLVEYIDHMGGDMRVVNTARVSFDMWKNEAWDPSAGDQGLIRYLGDHEPMHISPFFHPQVCLRLTTPIYVARQLFRHEVGASINEVSRRYVDDTPILEFPTEWRERPGRGMTKQGSGGLLPLEAQEEINCWIGVFTDYILGKYEWLLSIGVAAEQARTVLPLSLETKWIWTCSLAFLGRVCVHRLDGDAQEETRGVAKQIDAIMRPLYPVAWPVVLGEVRKTA